MKRNFDKIILYYLIYDLVLFIMKYDCNMLFVCFLKMFFLMFINYYIIVY